MSIEAAQSIPPVLVAQVESILYAAGEPASISAMATALETSTQDIELALEELARQCKSRGVRIQRHGNEAQLVTAPETAERIQKYLGLEAANRLSTAALETLAIIAYKQPMTKPQIEMIRGVNCDGVMKTLEMHNLIKELGRAETVGHPMRYGISFEFLEHFGLRDVHELPPIEKLDVLPSGDDAVNHENPLSTTDAQASPDLAPASASVQLASVVEEPIQLVQMPVPDSNQSAHSEEQPVNTLQAPAQVIDLATAAENEPVTTDQEPLPASSQEPPAQAQSDADANVAALTEIAESSAPTASLDDSA
ncbi:MAG TPA: SMC-Scp complex subunit ScpB [Anaerolineae bacterium]